MRTVWIGTSGWNYKHWRSTVYPAGLPQREWLGFITRHFSTVEINNPFYRIPAAETVASWAETVPRGFRFSVKVWRGITHYRNCATPAI